MGRKAADFIKNRNECASESYVAKRGRERKTKRDFESKARTMFDGDFVHRKKMFIFSLFRFISASISDSIVRHHLVVAATIIIVCFFSISLVSVGARQCSAGLFNIYRCVMFYLSFLAAAAVEVVLVFA